ncbi:CopD family protein [Undibacterium sp. TJN25]|uniref:CopD family protein n=1 Tax=Undibacterium sp. TJN25 TaxID=3413056 RepID=UPI003BF2920A
MPLDLSLGLGLNLASAQHAFTVALNLAMAVSVGANLSVTWAARSSSSWTAGYLPRLRKAALAAVLAAILASAALIWMEAAAMAEVDTMSAGPAVLTLLADTQYGHAWLGGLVFLLLAAGAASLLWRRNGRLPAKLGILFALAFFYTRSMSSHAAGDGNLTWVMLADWLHLSLISMWVGEVAIAGFLTFPGMRADSQSRADCARYLQALSSSASIAVAGIALTGIFNSMHNLSSFGELSGNPYGNTLLLKLATVLLAALLGGVNRFIVMPSLLAQLHDPAASLPALWRFVLVLRIEFFVLLSALILAALLSATSPPMMA